MMRLNHVLRPLLLLMLLFFCPALSWAEDDFCGSSSSRVSHHCGLHLGESCHCSHHQLCANLAAEESGQPTPPPVHHEVLCPLAGSQVPQPSQGLAPPPPLCRSQLPPSPCLTPVTPPPRRQA